MIHIATYCETAKHLKDEIKEYENEKIVVRLGGNQPYPDFKIQINSIEGIENCINKLRNKQLLIAANVPTLPLLDEDKIDKYPIVIKGIIRSCGDAVFVVDEAKELPVYKKLLKNKFYIEPLFTATSEYRLHCTQERCFFAVKKIKNDGVNDVIVTSKNHHNVRDFVKPRLWNQMLEAGVNAMKASKLEIGAIDFGYCSNGNHNFVIHEINTGPELLVNTREAYRKELEYLIDKKLAKK